MYMFVCLFEQTNTRIVWVYRKSVCDYECAMRAYVTMSVPVVLIVCLRDVLYMVYMLHDA